MILVSLLSVGIKSFSGNHDTSYVTFVVVGDDMLYQQISSYKRNRDELQNGVRAGYATSRKVAGSIPHGGHWDFSLT